MKLNRFTTLPILLDLLERKKLTLLDPDTWDDKNDTQVITAYKNKKGIKRLLAICFSHGDETVHHWKTFSDGTSGCVIEFDGKKLLEHIKEIKGLRHGKVVYKKLREVEDNHILLDVDDMPFTKRWPYRCEEEYRIILETENDINFFDLDFPIEFIKKITISQRMPEPIYKTIKNHLKGLRGDPESRISRSTLYENERWINSFKK